MMDFDATSLYPRAIWDEKTVYLTRESGFLFEPYMNNWFDNDFKNQIFNEDVNDYAILKIK